MSVTFWVPEAPSTMLKETCDFCADVTDPNWKCPACGGKGYLEYEESEAPSLNLANANARAILELVGLSTEECGRLTTDQIAGTRQQILRGLNSSRSRQSAVREEITLGGEDTCKVICCGYTDEQVQDRLTRFDKVLAYAQEHQMRVTWG